MKNYSLAKQSKTIELEVKQNVRREKRIQDKKNELKTVADEDRGTVDLRNQYYESIDETYVCTNETNIPDTGRVSIGMQLVIGFLVFLAASLFAAYIQFGEAFVDSSTAVGFALGWVTLFGLGFPAIIYIGFGLRFEAERGWETIRIIVIFLAILFFIGAVTFLIVRFFPFTSEEQGIVSAVMIGSLILIEISSGFISCCLHLLSKRMLFGRKLTKRIKKLRDRKAVLEDEIKMQESLANFHNQGGDYDDTSKPTMLLTN